MDATSVSSTAAAPNPTPPTLPPGAVYAHVEPTPLLAGISSGPAAAALFVGVALLVVVDAAALITALVCMDYPPLRARQLPLVALTFVAGVCWTVGAMQVHNMFDPATAVFRACAVWSVLLQVALGLQLVLSSIALRLYRLFRIFVQKQPTSGLGFYAVCIGIMLPCVGFGIAPFVLPATSVDWFEPTINSCLFNPAFKVLIFTLFGLETIFLGMFMLIVNSRIHIEAFREEGPNRMLFGANLAVLAMYLVVNATGLQWTTGGRVMLVVSVVAAMHSNLWTLLMTPFFFRYDECLIDFKLALNPRGTRGSSDDPDELERREHPEDTLSRLTKF
ncbi:hypothetical protein HK105_201764 [Polyrhizophydium stewartii]|uniref:G-protein coupled receptors family 3 profile domain-containing protein n=1 Tax=Polyrhizophydium stewartii TaxID=2732419 RepID=A0ABR4NHJ0_9FUNG